MVSRPYVVPYDLPLKLINFLKDIVSCKEGKSKSKINSLLLSTLLPTHGFTYENEN